MRKILAFILCGLVTGALAGQSLVDLAKKEKKRRDEGRIEGKSAKEYSDLNTSREESGDAAESTDAPDPSDESTEATGPEQTIEWKSVYGRYRVRYLHLENKMRMLDERAEPWCGLPPPEPDRKKFASQQARYRARCQAIRADQKELRGEMRAMQSDCLADAKKHGVTPGDARLGGS